MSGAGFPISTSVASVSAAAGAASREDVNAADFAPALAALRPYLLKRAIWLTRGRDMAEDLVQTTFARALQSRDLFTPGTNLKAWASTILHNEFYSHRRRSWRFAPWSDGIADSLASPFGQQESSVDLQQLACALNELPDSQREALVLIGLLGFSYEEAAVLLRCTIGTVKSRVSRARIALLNALKNRRASKRRLMPESGAAFAAWLATLEAVRVAARDSLAGNAGESRQKLPSAPKIRLKSDAAPRAWTPVVIPGKPLDPPRPKAKAA